MSERVRKFLLYLGIVLLLVNGVGQFLPWRNPAIYTEASSAFPNDIVLTEDQFYQAIAQARQSGDRKAFLRAATRAVAQGMADYWKDEGVDRYGLRVPFYKNYVLFLASFFDPEKFRKYELMDGRAALARGVGVCSQQSIVLQQVLAAEGIPASIVGLDGHVVVTAQLDDAQQHWWILDPLNGVVIPYDLMAIEQNPKLVLEYYQAAGLSASALQAYVKIYGPEGNKIARSVAEYAPRTYLFEQIANVLIWIIPLLLAVPVAAHSVMRWFARPRRRRW